MSKTAITSSGGQPDSPFDRRFGRAAWFCIYDHSTGKLTFHENDNLHANQDAGIKVAEKMIEMNIQKIISGDFGPKAEDILDKNKIQMVILKDDNITVQDIIDRLNR